MKIDPNHNNELKPDKIIAMMRVTKKTDPLFKPLKKLKNALDVVHLWFRVLGMRIYRSCPPELWLCFISGWEMNSIFSLFARLIHLSTASKIVLSFLANPIATWLSLPQLKLRNTLILNTLPSCKASLQHILS